MCAYFHNEKQNIAFKEFSICYFVYNMCLHEYISINVKNIFLKKNVVYCANIYTASHIIIYCMYKNLAY